MRLKFIFCLVAALTGGGSTMSWAANAGGPVAPDSAVPAGPFMGAFNGEPPSDLVSIAPNLLAIFDHVAGWVVFTDSKGSELWRERLPSLFRVGDVRTFKERTVLIDRDGKRKIVMPRYNDDSHPRFSVAAVPVAANDPDIAAPSYLQRAFRRAGLKAQAGAGYAAELQLFSLTDDFLVSATFLGFDSQGNAYSLARELKERKASADPKDSTTVIKVTLTVGKHDATGKRTMVGSLPLNEMFKIPRGHYVAVEPSGSIVALLPLIEKGARTQGVYLYRPELVDEIQQSRKATRVDLANGRKTLQAAVSAVSSSSVVQPDVGGIALHETKDAPVDRNPQNIPGRRKVSAMKDVASQIMGFTWTIKKENLALDNQKDCLFGKNKKDHSFELPHELKHAVPGSTYTGVPYNWGGKENLNDIRYHLQAGFRAGNICSEVNEKIENTTGLDCSGFVSQVWGIDEFDTDHVAAITTPISDIKSMQWGDVFNLPEHHIRLYVGQEKNAEDGMRIRTLESTSACGGTCEISYTVDHLNGYSLHRLKAGKSTEPKVAAVH
jgi:hypothetical protein